VKVCLCGIAAVDCDYHGPATRLDGTFAFGEDAARATSLTSGCEVLWLADDGNVRVFLDGALVDDRPGVAP
jgi:hypothetical protein